MRVRTRGLTSFLVTTTFVASVLASPFNAKRTEAVLATVDTSGCGAPIPDWVDVTFAPSGKVTAVEAQPGSYSLETLHCLVTRFEEVTVAPFDGEPRVVQFAIGASTAAAPATTTDEHHDAFEEHHGHFEKRSRSGLLVAGGVVLGVGALFLLTAYVDSKKSTPDCGGYRQMPCPDDSSSKDTIAAIFGGGLMILGTALLVAGAMGHTVYVQDPPRPKAQILPWFTHGGGGVGMTITL